MNDKELRNKILEELDKSPEFKKMMKDFANT